MTQQRDPNRIFIGICLRTGDTRWETTMSLIGLIVASAPTEYSFVIEPGGGCDVAHARNLLLHHCDTRTNCGRLVFMDADTLPTVADFWALLAHNVPYVGGLYPLKGFQCRWSWNGYARLSEVAPPLWNVEELCTGFCCIRHDLITAMRSRYPQTAYTIEDHAFRGETGFELFAMGPSKGRRLSEDFSFSLRVHAIGVEVNVDPTILVGHIGALDLLAMHRAHGTFAAPALRE